MPNAISTTQVISSTILQIHINPFLIPSSIHFHFHLINSIQTSHQHSHSHKHSIHSYPISYPYTYHPLLYHTHFISNHTSPLITHHMPLSLHQSITHHPYYSYTNYPFLPIFTLNTFTLVPNAISTNRSFLQLSSKSTSIHFYPELPFFGVFVKPSEMTESTFQRRPKTTESRLFLVRPIRLLGMVIGSEATTLYMLCFLNYICSCSYISLELLTPTEPFCKQAVHFDDHLAPIRFQCSLHLSR